MIPRRRRESARNLRRRIPPMLETWSAEHSEVVPGIAIGQPERQPA